MWLVQSNHRAGVPGVDSRLDWQAMAKPAARLRLRAGCPRDCVSNQLPETLPARIDFLRGQGA